VFWLSGQAAAKAAGAFALAAFFILGCRRGFGAPPVHALFVEENPLILWASARYRDQPYNSG
jgi:hypothetical protein